MTHTPQHLRCAKLLACLALLLHGHGASARTYAYVPGSQHHLIGKLRTVTLGTQDTLEDVARQEDIGYDELLHANPGLTTDALVPGTVLVLPTRYVIPQHVHRRGIVVNLAEKRMYVFNQTDQVTTYPVGIGRKGWSTPLGQMRIVSKQANPTWFPTASVKAAQAAEGIHLPDRVPPGPDNPLGHYLLRLSKTQYLIHGTNDPDGVGKRSSAGCLRMYPEDIKTLFHRIPVGTQVEIVYQPLKVAPFQHRLLLESHAPLSPMDPNDKNLEDSRLKIHRVTLSEATRLVVHLAKQQHVPLDSMGWVERCIRSSTGIPLFISH